MFPHTNRLNLIYAPVWKNMLLFYEKRLKMLRSPKHIKITTCNHWVVKNRMDGTELNVASSCRKY